MACTCLVAAKSGTKGKLRLRPTGTTLRRLVGATPVAHDKENLRQTVRQAQFAIAEPAGIELTGHKMQALLEVRERPGMAATGLDKRVWGAIKVEVPFSTPQQDAAIAGVRSPVADPTDESNLEKREKRHDGVQDNSGTGPGRSILSSGIRGHITTGRTAKRIPPSATSSFLDDFTLAVLHDAAETARQLARVKLAAVAKSMMYTPSQVAPLGMEDWWEETTRRPHHSWKTAQH